MATREEIREGLYRELIAQAPTEGWSGKVDRILGFLHSQGCVLKVDRELPQNPYVYESRFSKQTVSSPEYQAYRLAQKDMAGYIATEPLIKEVNSG